MGINLKETDKNVFVVTQKENSELTSFQIFHGKEKVNVTNHKYLLSTSKIVTNYPTSNGFNTSTFSYFPQYIEPRIILRSFDLQEDQDHRLIIELKLLFKKIASFLQEKSINISSGIIQEVVYFDNDEEDELSFSLEFVITNIQEISELLKLEEEVWDFVEGEETFKLRETNMIEVIVSLTISEDISIEI